MITVVDTVRPTYTRPANITFYKDANCHADTSTTAAGEPTNVNDNCTANPTVTYRDEAQVVDCEGAYHFNRVWRVVDGCGNVSLSDSVQVITVVDTVRPTYTRPVDITLYKNGSCEVDTTTATTNVPTSVADNCTAAPTVTYRDANIVTDCEGTYHFDRIWRVVDACGNVSVSDSVQTITVVDTVRPTFTAPVAITICRAADGTYNVTPDVTGVVADTADNCTAKDNLVVTYSDDIVPTNDAHATEVITRTWKVTDACSNFTEHTQTITVNPAAYMDTPANQIICHDSNMAAVNFTTTITDGSMSYSWSRDNTANVEGVAANGTGNINMAALKNMTETVQTTTFTVTPTYTNNGSSCVGTPVTFTVTVNPEVLLSATNTLQNKVFGEAIDNVVVSHSSHSDLTYSTLPAGLTYTASTGILSGTPTTVGNYTVTFTATSTQTPNCGVKTQVVNINVAKRDLTIVINDSKTYDGTQLVTDYTEATAAALQNGATLTAGAVTTPGKDVATYTDNTGANVTTAFATSDGISNYNVSYDFTQEITKRIVHIATADSSRLFDGTPLVQPAYTITGDGFVPGEVTNIHTTGTVTAISTCVDNTIEYTPVAGAFIASNYTIDTTLGQLCVTGSLAPITVTSASAADPIIYDGQAHGDAYKTYTVTYDGNTLTPVAGSNGLKFAFPTQDTLTITPTFTGVTNVADANDTTHNNVFTYTIQNAEAYLGTKTITYGTVKLAPRPITISLDSSKVYDGTPFEVSYAQLNVSNMVAGESLTAGTVTSSSYNVGEYLCSDGVFSYMMELAADQSGFDVSSAKSNYAPQFNVKLTITSRNLTITADGATKVYDGTLLTASGFSAEGLASTDALSVTTSGSQLCVGESANTVATYQVTNSGENVTGNYNVTTVPGVLKVTPITTGFAVPADVTITLIEGTADTMVTTAVTGEATLTPAAGATEVLSHITVTNNLDALNRMSVGTHKVVWKLYDECNNEMVVDTQVVIVKYEDCEGTITMSDGHAYGYKRIGSQCWFTENLRVPTGNYHAYNDNSTNFDKFGYLYSWYTAVGVTEDDTNAAPLTHTADDGTQYVQGICPDGWAIPSQSDVEVLNTSGFDADMLKDPSTEYWMPGYEGTGESGFKARAGGRYNVAMNRYEELMTGFHFWQSDAPSGSVSLVSACIAYYCGTVLTNTPNMKNDRKSIRCLRKNAH